jgi:hypothetical protein
MFTGALSHDAEADEVTTRGRVITDAGADHSVDVVAGVYHPRQLLEIGRPQLATDAAMGNVKCVPGKHQRATSRVQLPKITVTVGDPECPGTLFEGPLNQVLRNVNHVLVGDGSSSLLHQSHDIRIVHSHTHIAKDL